MIIYYLYIDSVSKSRPPPRQRIEPATVARGCRVCVGGVAGSAAVDEILKNLEKSRMYDIIFMLPIDS